MSRTLRDQSIYSQGFARVCAASVPVHLGFPERNAEQIIQAATECSQLGAALAVFPEMSVTGYSIDDLVEQDELLESACAAIDLVAAGTADLSPILVVGAPLKFNSALYNCAVLIHRGNVLGIVPKSYLPSYREFYDKRYYSTRPATGIVPSVDMVVWSGGLKPASSTDARAIPFGNFHVSAADVPGFQLAVEVCEDLWVPIPPSSIAALSGATVIANPSASPVTVGRARRREDLVRAQSGATLSAYVYTAAGFGESSNDLAWDGQALIAEAGELIAQSERFQRETSIAVADIDLWDLQHRRLVQNSFADNAKSLGLEQERPLIVEVTLDPPEVLELKRPNPQFPFFHGDPEKIDIDCYEAFNIQIWALVRRMVSMGTPKLILGVSGGLDSTHALLVATKAMDSLERPRTDIVAYTMPGFGTTSRTRQNAEALCKSLGVTFHELDIRPAAEVMLQAMGHPYSQGEPHYDVVFENVQAGLRTDYLFRLAGQQGGFVVGTGDMSELALGWCTYGVGDQMGHYGVNAGLPKTMIQHLIRWVARNVEFAVLDDASSTATASLPDVLESILATEISPELVPSDGAEPTQSTQAIIGPYELQDFTLFHVLKGGASPSRIAYLQAAAWGGDSAEGGYSDKEILHWIEVFFRRFFANQYKRTAVPNSPKIVGAGSLSPRGDWRMPSDALASQWLNEIEQLKNTYAIEGDGSTKW